MRMCGNQGDPVTGAQDARTQGQAITSEEVGGGGGKSEGLSREAMTMTLGQLLTGQGSRVEVGVVCPHKASSTSWRIRLL